VSLSDLDVVKSLYVSAAYEDVLQHLSKLDSTAITAPLEQYRALSLFALGRRPEAEASIERLVRQSPFYVIDENEVSPRLAGVFRDVRQRVLPSVTRDLYAQGKASFEKKQYGPAADQLKSLLSLLEDQDLAKQADPGGDVKQLAEGFLRLSELEVSLAARTAAAAPNASQESAGLQAPTITKIVIYSAADSGVTPPVEIDRRMPPWAPPAIMARNAAYRGQLEIVVNEGGQVESAVMVKPTIETYDVLLIDAARRWRFVAAKRGAEAVKYRLTYDVSLLGTRR
jgi:tetratricopeptide (TPR) repeat protein